MSNHLYEGKERNQKVIDLITASLYPPNHGLFLSFRPKKVKLMTKLS